MKSKRKNETKEPNKALKRYRTCSKRSRSCFSDSPTHLLSKSAPLRIKNDTFRDPKQHSLASALAISVFPVPTFRKTPNLIISEIVTNNLSQNKNTYFKKRRTGLYIYNTRKPRPLPDTSFCEGLCEFFLLHSDWLSEVSREQEVGAWLYCGP